MQPTQPSKTLWLIVLALFWAMFGLTGRDAWKSEEALALAPILDWLAGAAPLWSTPAPLYTAVAGALVKLAPAGWDVQDAARLASGVFTALTLSFTALAARALYGPGFGAAAVLALMGGFGLMLRAHALLPETALLAVWAMLLYGMSIARQHVDKGGAVMGLALALLTLGLRGPVDLLAGIAVITLPLLTPDGRERNYRRAVQLGLASAAVLIGLALAALWAYGLLPSWRAGHSLAQPVSAPARIFSELAWFAWPLWPLALGAVWHVHRNLKRATGQHTPLIALVVLLAAALFPAWSRDGGLLPVLLPLALLAAYAVDILRRGAAQAFYWFGVLCFLFFVLAFWVYFSATEWGAPTRLAAHVARLTPSYRAGTVEQSSVLLAAAATLIWLIAIPLFPRAKSRPVLVWATGMALTWLLITTLFRPWVEAGWAYRPLIADMAHHLPQGACLTTRVDPAMNVMLRYHLKDHPLKEAQTEDCSWTLILITRKAGEALPEKSKKTAWEGFRPRYKNQIYRLENTTLPPLVEEQQDDGR